jgi:hypothetical protein
MGVSWASFVDVAVTSTVGGTGRSFSQADRRKTIASSRDAKRRWVLMRSFVSYFWFSKLNLPYFSTI